MASETADPAFCFKQYVDSIMDLLNLPHPQVYSYYYSRFFFFRSVSFDDLSIAKLCAQIKNHYKGEEILFLGPDEGTAGLMDWAANHARKRGSLFPLIAAVSMSYSVAGTGTGRRSQRVSRRCWAASHMTSTA